MLFIIIIGMSFVMIGGVAVAMVYAHRELRPKGKKDFDPNEFTHFV